MSNMVASTAYQQNNKCTQYAPKSYPVQVTTFSVSSDLLIHSAALIFIEFRVLITCV